MPLNIKNAETHAAARKLAKLTGLTISDAVDQAIREKLRRIEEQRDADWERTLAAIREIQDRVASAPVYDPRTPQEIMDDMYDDDGLPK